MYITIYLHIYIYNTLSIRLKHSWAHTLYFRSSIYLSVYLSAYLTIYLSIYLAKRLTTFFIQSIRASAFPFLVDYSRNCTRLYFQSRFKTTFRTVRLAIYMIYRARWSPRLETLVPTIKIFPVRVLSFTVSILVRTFSTTPKYEPKCTSLRANYTCVDSDSNKSP